jgi:hypothetical protein
MQINSAVLAGILRGVGWHGSEIASASLLLVCTFCLLSEGLIVIASRTHFPLRAHGGLLPQLNDSLC